MPYSGDIGNNHTLVDTARALELQPLDRQIQSRDEVSTSYIHVLLALRTHRHI
jgi:hypothetical protein